MASEASEPKDPWGRFESYFFGPVDTRLYSLLRVSVAVVCLINWLDLLPFVDQMFLERGGLPRTLPLGSRKYSLFSLLSDDAIALTFWIIPVVMVALLLGRGARVWMVLLWLWTLSYNLYSSLQTGGWDVLLRTSLFLLVFSPLGAPLVGSQRGRPTTSSRHGLLLIRAHLCLLYLATFWHKVPSIEWRSGELMGYFFLSMYSYVDGTKLLNFPIAIALMTYGALLSEGALPFLLLGRRTRRWGLAVGLLLHLTIAVTSNLTMFSLAILAFYPAFFESEDLDAAKRLFQRIARNKPGKL